MWIHCKLYILNRKQVQATKEDAERDGVKVPTTLQEYCVSIKPQTSQNSVDDTDFYDEDYDLDDDEEEDNYYDDEDDDDDDDSGNGGEGSWCMFRLFPL